MLHRFLWATTLSLLLTGPAFTMCADCDFSGQNLAFADFRDQDLSGANFSDAYLVNAKFDDANLESADFRVHVQTTQHFAMRDCAMQALLGPKLSWWISQVPK